MARESVTDRATRDEVIELLEETIDKIEKWGLYEDQWISNYVNEAKEVIDGLGSYEELNEYHKLIINSIKEILKSLLNRVDNDLRNYWVSKLGNEVAELIQDIISGKAQVIINRTSKTLAVHVYRNHITLDINKIRNNSGITTQLRIKGLRGINIEIPNIFEEILDKEEYEKLEKETLTPLKLGFAITDETTRNGKPVMITAHLWQAILWMLLYPGKIYISINAIDINKNDVKIKWYLVANDYVSLKDKAIDILRGFNYENLLRFMSTVILGDGNVTLLKHSNSKARLKPVIKISIGQVKFNEWEPILSMLKNHDIDYEIFNSAKGEVPIFIRGNNAINLARKIFDTIPPVIRVLFDVLNIDKWNKLKRMINLMPIRGTSQIKIAGIRFSIDVLKRGVELRVVRCNEVDVHKIIKQLKQIYGENFDVRKRRAGKCVKVVIPWDEVKAREDIKMSVIPKLYEMLNRTKNEKKKEQIIRALTELDPNYKG
ncbi:hypothetical protein [Vulcanisaeta sp. JCM 16161]|uniref:hypothetical protein n=1 Tax=Vulcanisaeta sp. JCM 16161 TaxID=1295372 RepID=UPI00406C09AC